MNFKVSAMVACLALSSTSALAEQFYIDVGTDFGGNSNTAAGATTTGLLDQMTYIYQSQTVVTDADASGTVNVGDGIVTNGGLDLTSDATLNASFNTNSVTNFNPVMGLNGPSNNDFNTDWFLSFTISNLTGTVGPNTSLGNANPADNVVETLYTSGDITFYYLQDVNGSGDFNKAVSGEVVKLFTISLNSSSQSLGGSFIKGTVTSVGAGSVNGVAAGDVFNFADGSFGSALLNPISDALTVIDFNADNPAVTPVAGGFKLTGEHDGSIDFRKTSIPEPASIAVFALGLLGLAGLGRKKA